MLVGSHISENSISWKAANKITEKSNSLIPATRLYANDLVMVRVGDPGVTAVIPPELDGCNCASMMIIRQGREFDSNWLCYVMNSDIGRNQVENVQYGTAQKQFNISDAINFVYPTPPLAEQKAISYILSEFEALIRRLDELIAKKRDIKQAAMQQLLTGQKRLPGFSGEWHAGALADVISSLEAGVSVNSTDDIPSQGVPSILKTSSLVGGVFLPHECKVIATRDLQRAQTRPKKDTILISRMNTPMLVGEVAYVDRDYEWLYLPDRVWMSAFKPGSETSARWLAYLLSSRNYRDQLREIATGTSGSMKNISKGALLALPVQYPSPSEQAAIATILSDMDAELAALEARRDKARQLKQGMMQELLTGRIRLLDPQPTPSGLPAPELSD